MTTEQKAKAAADLQYKPHDRGPSPSGIDYEIIDAIEDEKKGFVKGYVAGDANARLECAGVKWLEALKEIDEFTQVEYWANSDTMKEIHRVIQEALITSPSPNPLEVENEKLKKQLEESLLLYQNMCNAIAKQLRENERLRGALKELVELKDMKEKNIHNPYYPGEYYGQKILARAAARKLVKEK